MTFNPNEAMRGRMLVRDTAVLSDALRDTDAFLSGYEYAVSAEAHDDWQPYEVTATGAAIIEVSGTLVHKLGLIGGYRGIQGYDGIEAQIAMAEADDNVAEIILDIHSGGGTVFGVDECARIISEAKKPVTAYVNAAAFSAAYWLACAADRIVAVSEGAEVGSIGVISEHEEMSGAFERMGVKFTTFKAGELKDMGSDTRPITDAEKAVWQADINKVYGRFVGWVAERRGLSVEAVRATEADTYFADEALENGLIDAIQNKDEILKATASGAGRVANQEGAFLMADQKGRDNAADKGVDIDAMKAEWARESEAKQAAAITAAVEAAKTEALAEAKAAADVEKARVSAVMALPEAEGREAVAAKLAEKGLSADDAKDILAIAGKSYSALMDEDKGAGVDAGDLDKGNGEGKNAAARDEVVMM